MNDTDYHPEVSGAYVVAAILILMAVTLGCGVMALLTHFRVIQ